MSGIKKRPGIGAPVVLSLLLIFYGCSFLQLKKESKISYNSKVLAGRVTGTLCSDTTPVVVAAYTKKKSSRTIVHYRVLQGPGPYELMVPQGDYYLVAFADKNRNLVYDKDEPAGQYRGAEKIRVTPGGVVGDLDIVIHPPGGKKIDFPAGSRVSPDQAARIHYTSPGAIANLDDPIFSDEFAAKGYWSPLEFFNKASGNIYFLEKYDPKKIPILFVHGACGSPRGWRFFFDHIDRDKFQPWFFYYPSGASIKSMSYLLFWKIYNLQSKYQFKTLYIVAHSMGGLVVRSFLVNFAPSMPLRYTFISISTPWGGDRLADMGVKYSPAVIPAWKDIRASGTFIQSLYRKKLPATVDQYLFFSYRGNRNPLRPNNDQVVTLASELDQRAQADAKMIYGFDEDHDSILSSESAVIQLNAILTASYENKGNTPAAAGNMLRVDISYDYPDELPKPQPILLLRHADASRSETVLYLKSGVNSQKVGPVPPGKYNASLVAWAFTPRPRRIPVFIRKGATPVVHFLMKPHGCLLGYIAGNKKPIPAGSFLEPDDQIQINKIILRGAGINRSLVPIKGTTATDFFDHYLFGTDFAGGAYFCFFHLPKGEYKLSITARGCLPYSADYMVKPGKNYNFSPVLLQRENIDD
jgi:pimeloyl-ACP methyl ester carboxylesterase